MSTQSDQGDAYRVLDANLNRLREALRVLEDHARFVLDDAAAARRAKELRHMLREIAARLGATRLLEARDLAGDVGREQKTANELERHTTDDVVGAALARAGEAARVVAEYAKLIDRHAADAAERLRYAAYELEPALRLRGPRLAALRRARLYVIISESACRAGWRDTARAVLEAGCRCLQLREKQLADAELVRRARELRALTHEFGALFILNDRPDLARLCAADGVHVGQDDLSVREARRVGGGTLLVGKSTHNIAQLHAAVDEAPDYIAVGPMFASPTKPQPDLAGVETLQLAAAHFSGPRTAIGGITPERAAAMLHAGASAVCVCSAVVGAHDAAVATAAFLDALGQEGPQADALRT
jgi:thiamine-phosphate pyrophosphorylase